MAWVKIDDQLADHPKIVAAGAVGGWAFVAGLCYCNRFLTNGFIPLAQIEKLASDVPMERLCELGLWTKTTKKGVEGVLVHDYLKYQMSRTDILKAREQSAIRQGRHRNSKRNGKRNAVTSDVSSTVSSPAPTPTPTPTPGVSKERLLPAAPDMRSHHPAFKGERIVVFDWMLVELMGMLGAHAEDFDWHAWFFTLDGLAGQETRVIANRDERWKWIQEKTAEEAKRRGLRAHGEAYDAWRDGQHGWQCGKCGEVHQGKLAQRGQCLKQPEVPGAA